jgi:plasmid stability protein
MPVTLSVKNVPDHVAELLRRRAARNHRSLQGELLAILEETVVGPARLSPREILRRVRSLGVKTTSESARFVRGDRDAR